MKIKKIAIQNIRSYKKGEITFPSGSVLLSGDIGSGKSSILLAAEFALFGLQRGMGGHGLLRRGEKKGSVKLEFEIDNMPITIERSLKKSKETVQQETGFIEFNGKKEQLSTLELRSRILSLLNYPQEFLTKNPILYRYTVYTPQEEMKTILLEDAELRLNMLRRVFSIDKYKRIIENSERFCRCLREKLREKEGIVIDLVDKKTERETRADEKKKLKSEIITIKLKLDDIRKILFERAKTVKELEEKTKEVSGLKTELAAVLGEEKTKHEQLMHNKESSSELKKNIDLMEKRLKKEKVDGKIIDEIEGEIEKKEGELKKLETDFLRLNGEMASLEANKARELRIMDSVVALSNCPTCKQQVSNEHKSAIKQRTEEEVKKFMERIKKAEKEKQEIEKKKVEIAEKLKELREKDRNLRLARIELKNLEEKKAMLKKVEEMGKQINKSLSVLKEKKQKLEEKISVFHDIEKRSFSAKNMLDEAREEEKGTEIIKARCEKQFENIEENITKLDKEIFEKEKVKKEIAYLRSLKTWLSERFTKIVGEIEKAVMAKVHCEFSQLFGKWFSMLAEGLNARIDEEFTPIIEQAGYELEYGYLSGGERTAAALAYRLALNQVINSLLSEIKTRDLLILDEPTDGFSSEQLDRMRDVLNELKVGQLILVSHENKIESFVENVMKLRKEDGVTSFGSFKE